MQSMYVRTEMGMAFVVALTLLLAFSPHTQAGEVIEASQDAYISDHDGLGGSNANHGSDAVLFSIWGNGGSPGVRAFPLVQFDLSSLPSGAAVIGDATLELFVMGTAFAQFTRTVSVHEVLIPWDDVTVTFNNFGATPDVDFGVDVGASSLDVQPVAYPAPGDRFVSWTIPQAVIQGWMDDPASNHGILVFNQEAANFLDLQFSSLEGANAPSLTFVLDSDGDGVADEDDCQPESDLSATVALDGCDSGVTNLLFDDGCTILDLIWLIAEDAHNHGRFVSGVAHLLNDLKRNGVLTGLEKGAIQSCAAQGDIP